MAKKPTTTRKRKATNQTSVKDVTATDDSTVDTVETTEVSPEVSASDTKSAPVKEETDKVTSEEGDENTVTVEGDIVVEGAVVVEPEETPTEDEVVSDDTSTTAVEEVPPTDAPATPEPAPVGSAASVEETQEARRERKRAEAKDRARKLPWVHIDDYLEKMHPSVPNNRASIVGHQQRLAQAFVLLLSEEDDDSIAIESAKKLVETIRARRKPGSVFHDSMCMRYVNDLANNGLPQARIVEFQNILFALLELADKGNKVVMDWEVFTQRCIKGRGEKIASRLQRACNVKID